MLLRINKNFPYYDYERWQHIPFHIRALSSPGTNPLHGIQVEIVFKINKNRQIVRLKGTDIEIEVSSKCLTKTDFLIGGIHE